VSAPDFFRGGQPVNFRIRRVFKLLRHIVIRISRCQLFRLLDRPFMPSAPGVSTNCAPKDGKKLPSLHGHCVRHRQYQFVSPGGGDEGQGDAGVPAGWFNDYGIPS